MQGLGQCLLNDHQGAAFNLLNRVLGYHTDSLPEQPLPGYWKKELTSCRNSDQEGSNTDSVLFMEQWTQDLQAHFKGMENEKNVQLGDNNAVVLALSDRISSQH